MKKIFLAFLIIHVSVCSKAQFKRDKEYSFNAGIEMGHAIGYFSTNHSLGFGLSAQSEYASSEITWLTVNIGYLSFATKSVYDTLPLGIFERKQKAFGIIPVLGGLKFTFGNSKMYGHTQIGFLFKTDGIIAAAYAIGVGTKTSEHADFSIRYQAAAKLGVIGSFIMVRAAYIF